MTVMNIAHRTNINLLGIVDQSVEQKVASKADIESYEKLRDYRDILDSHFEESDENELYIDELVHINETLIDLEIDLMGKPTEKTLISLNKYKDEHTVYLQIQSESY